MTTNTNDAATTNEVQPPVRVLPDLLAALNAARLDVAALLELAAFIIGHDQQARLARLREAIDAGGERSKRAYAEANAYLTVVNTFLEAGLEQQRREHTH